MKHKGSVSDFIDERNEELMKSYHSLIVSSDYVCLENIYKEVVEMPASRFWVSEERASIVVAAMMRREDAARKMFNKMTECNKEMYQEIYRRVCDVRRENPDMTMYDACCRVVQQPAPKFYMTPGSVKVIICKRRTKWYEERKRKLRHLFW